MAFSLSLGNLEIYIRGDNSNFAKSMQQTEMLLDKVSQKARKVGKSLTRYVTLPVLGMATASVKAFADFNSAMAQSLAIMDNVGPGMRNQMEQTAKTLSTQGVQSASELARSYFFLASAGLNAEQSIAALPVVTNFATAGMFDMAQATDLLTDAQSALGLTVKDTIENQKNMLRISDVLVKANTLANASVEQFSTALTSKAGTAMKSYNIDLEEGVSVLAAYADQGIKAQLAGNMFDRMLRLLIKSINDNGKAFENMNIRTKDAAGNLVPLADIIEDITKATAGMGSTQKAATLEMLGFEARSQQAILPLLGLSKNIRQYETNLRKAGGITEEVTEKQLKSFSSQMKILWNNAKVASIEIGEVLAPAIKDVGAELKKGIDWFRGLEDEVRRNIIQYSLLAAAIGPVVLVFGAAATAAKVLVAAIALTPTILLVTTLAAGAWALADAFTGGELAFGDLVRGIKVGGHSIGVWFDLMISNIQNGWEDMIWGLERSWMQLNKKLSDTWEDSKLAAKTSWEALKVTFGADAMIGLQNISNAFKNHISTKTKAEEEHNRRVAEIDVQKKERAAALAAFQKQILDEELAYEESRRQAAWLRKQQRMPSMVATTENTFGVLADQSSQVLQQETELSMYEEFLASKNALLEQYGTGALLLQSDVDKARVAQEKATADALKALQVQKNQQLLNGTSALFGMMAQVALAGGEKNFKIYKAFALTEAIISTYSAANKALNAPPGPPFTIPMATAVMGMGLLRARQIAMAHPGGGFSGGGGGGGAYTGTPTIPTNADEFVTSESEETQRQNTTTIIIENVHGSVDEQFVDMLANSLRDRVGDGQNYGFVVRAD